jgi:hypothetical protein
MSEIRNPFDPSEGSYDNPFDLGSDAFAGNPFEEDLTPSAASAPEPDTHYEAPQAPAPHPAPELPLEQTPRPAPATNTAPPAPRPDPRPAPQTPPAAPPAQPAMPAAAPQSVTQQPASPAPIPAAQQPILSAQQQTVPQPTSPAPQHTAQQPAQHPTPPTPAPQNLQSNTQTPPALTPALPADDPNPLLAEMTRREQTSIFAKPPVFEYGSATEEIADPAQTFDQLRAAKADDFPELEDERRVSWSVVYGKITKTINSAEAKSKKIGEVKATIEASKEFISSLKTAKDKSPRCVVKPRVTAQSKGDLPAYKGIFGSLDDALRSDKVISLMPSSDGRMYEMRRTELGTFTAPASCRGIQEVKAGFIPALPLVPRELTLEIIGFFRSLVNSGNSLEAIVNILWDKEREAFCTFVPPQTVSRGSAAAELPKLHSRYLHYIDVHSHNTMPARFSAVDDADEKATRVYAVFGRLDRFLPEISVRISSGGSFSELDPLTVFEPLGKAYPESWNARVMTGGSEI